MMRGCATFTLPVGYLQDALVSCCPHLCRAVGSIPCISVCHTARTEQQRGRCTQTLTPTCAEVAAILLAWGG
jgi:hypothetical protein